MKDISSWALNTADQRGASYADVRIANDRSRALSTKNGTVAGASDSESFGIGVRVIAEGAWGFAASDDLSRTAVDATAARAVDIAKASSRVKQRDLQLVPEKPVTAEWTTPFQIDPFTTSVEQNIDLLLKINAQAYSIEAANPRHEHEWLVWEDVKLPEGKILMPGVVSHAISHVEHPQLIAQRITRFAKLVGRENVVASTDCGFAQASRIARQHPSIVWAKLEAMAEGARIAWRGNVRV